MDWATLHDLDQDTSKLLTPNFKVWLQLESFKRKIKSNVLNVEVLFESLLGSSSETNKENIPILITNTTATPTVTPTATPTGTPVLQRKRGFLESIQQNVEWPTVFTFPKEKLPGDIISYLESPETDINDTSF